MIAGVGGGGHGRGQIVKTICIVVIEKVVIARGACVAGAQLATERVDRRAAKTKQIGRVGVGDVAGVSVATTVRDQRC